MNIDLAAKRLIEISLISGTGATLPSINQLTMKYGGSRGVYQDAIKLVQEMELLHLTITKRGTKIEAINHKRILEYYFPKLFISLPQVSLEKTQDNLTSNIIEKITTLTSSSLYFSFSDSTLERLNSLSQNDSQLVVVSDSYYNDILHNDFKILADFNISETVYTKLYVKDSPKLEYNLEEVSISTLKDNNQAPYNKPTSYYLICKPQIYSLLNETD